MQQPKNITKNFKYRNIPIGKERRRNYVKTVLHNQPHFPKSVVYEDIDKAISEWVSTGIELEFEGNRFPTYKLFSNQRISEYGQNWQHLDEKGNLELNFKTVTRESNPQHGDNQGNTYNIPGYMDYPIFQVPVLDENGDEIIEVYTMKQPTAVNLIYTVNIVTSSYKKINEMNAKILKEFNGLEKYIFPNGFAMPMLLNSVSDESDYLIDDRRYYSQAYQLKVMAYIIYPEDYKVTKVRSRKKTFIVGENSNRKKEREKFDIGTFKPVESRIQENIVYGNDCDVTREIEIIPEPINYDDIFEQSKVEMEELDGKQKCWEDTEDEVYVNKKVIINVETNYCYPNCEFEIDMNLELETMELKNTKKLVLKINGEAINYEESDVVFNKGDRVYIEATPKDVKKSSLIKFITYDPMTLILNDGNAYEHNEEYQVE